MSIWSGIKKIFGLASSPSSSAAPQTVAEPAIPSRYITSHMVVQANARLMAGIKCAPEAKRHTHRITSEAIDRAGRKAMQSIMQR